MGDTLPGEILNRGKHGFEVPIDEWIRGDLKDYVRSYLNEGRIKREGFFEWEIVERLLDDLRKVCEKEENVMPVIMEATKEGATVGEICDIYREIWGIWDPPLAI